MYPDIYVGCLSVSWLNYGMLWVDELGVNGYNVMGIDTTTHQLYIV